MVVPALCIPCMTAAASTGPAAPLVLGAAAVGYYSLKKNKTKRKRKAKSKKISKNQTKTKQKGGSRRRKKLSSKKLPKEFKKKCCKCHYIKSKKSLRRVKGK